MEAENKVLNDEDVLLPSELKELNENTEENEKKPNVFSRFIKWIKSWKL